MARALILKRSNPLAYPGGNPGFDPNHILVSAGPARFSGIAANTGGGFRSILRPNIGTITGSPTSAINGIAGPLYVANPAGGTAVRFSGLTLAVDTAMTFAGIVVLSGTFSVFRPFVCIGGNTGGTGPGSGVEYCTLTSTDISFGADTLVTATFPVTLPLSTPLYVVGAVNTTSCYGIVLNLANGQIFKATSTGWTNTVTLDGFCDVGAEGGLSHRGSIAAVAAAAGYLSFPAAMQTTKDPWSFWYPQPFDLAKSISIDILMPQIWI